MHAWSPDANAIIGVRLQSELKLKDKVGVFFFRHQFLAAVRGAYQQSVVYKKTRSLFVHNEPTVQRFPVKQRYEILSNCTGSKQQREYRAMQKRHSLQDR